MAGWSLTAQRVSTRRLLPRTALVLALLIHAVWLQIENEEDRHYLFFQPSVDPDYDAPLEAAYKSHFSPGGRFFSYGVFGILLWPLLFAAPVQYFSARHANGKMDEFFVERAIGNRATAATSSASRWP